MSKPLESKSSSFAGRIRKVAETTADCEPRRDRSIYRLFPATRYCENPTGFLHDRLPGSRLIWLERGESGCPHAVPRDHLRGGDSRIASALRLGAEHRDYGRGLLGLCRLAAGGIGHAVRPLRYSVRSYLDRSRQCDPVHVFCDDLDRGAPVRPSPAKTRSHVRRRGALALGVTHAKSFRFLRPAGVAQLRDYHRLYLGHCIRVLARSQRTFGLALARDLHAVRSRRTLLVAYAVRRHAAVAADQPKGIRQRLAHHAQL